MIPRRFTGGWARRSLRLGDGPEHESATVVWLQGALHFTDIRVPRPDAVAGPGRPVPPPMSFAGTTSWDEAGSRLHWRHALDLDDPGVEEGGEVAFAGEDLIETGAFVVDGRQVPYVEVWERLPGSDGAVLVLQGEHGLMVQAGRHSTTVVDRRPRGGDFASIHRVRDDDGTWSTACSLGDGAAALPAPPAPEPEGRRLVLGGESWTVVESWTPADRLAAEDRPAP